jgi:molybdate transport system substrate-binding protein
MHAKRFVAAVAALAIAPVLGADMAVLAAGAVKSPFNAAAADWEKASGVRIRAAFAPIGELRKRIAAGEPADLVIVPAEALSDLEAAGAVLPGSRRDLGVVAIGAAVKQGATVPDISTPEALKRTLHEVKTLTYMDPQRGTSGKHFDETVLPKLGMREEVRAKATLGEGGAIAEKVARGEVEIAFHQMSEMLPVAGITIVGPLPAELQKLTVYSGAVGKRARDPEAARRLLDYLASPAGRKAFTERGFSAPAGPAT